MLADGGVSLGIYLRYSIRGIPYREIPNPTIDSLVLTASEWKALVPTKVEADHEWTIKEDVGRKFCRVLGPGDENTMPRPNEVKYVRLTGNVQSIKNGVALIAFTGKIAGAHETQSNRGLCHGEAQLTGTGRYDVKTGRMLALVWVFDGVFRNVAPHDEPTKYSGVVEWRQQPR